MDDIKTRIAANAQSYADYYKVDLATFITNYMGLTEEEYENRQRNLLQNPQKRSWQSQRSQRRLASVFQMMMSRQRLKQNTVITDMILRMHFFLPSDRVLIMIMYFPTR